MEKQKSGINTSYERFYADRKHSRVYPTEFVVRTFLANYPGLDLPKPKPGSTVLDVAFGDGRNTAFLCDQGYAVSGVEITQGIVDQTKARIADLGLNARLLVGRNSSLPFKEEEFDYILACHCIYYCDDGETLLDNLREYSRVLKSGGFLIASVANRASFIFDEAEEQPDGSMLIKKDHYQNRIGYRLRAFSSIIELEKYFAPLFKNFSFGSSDNNYFGISEKLFWVVCQKN